MTASAELLIPEESESALPTTRAELIEVGRASFIGLPNPKNRRERIWGSPPAGWSITRILKEAGMHSPPEDHFVLVVLNGRQIEQADRDTTTVCAGDRVRAYVQPGGIETLFLFFLSYIVGTLVGIGVPSAIATGIGIAGAIVGTAGVYAAAGYTLQLVASAIIGQPDQGSVASISTRQSQTAINVGNRIQQDQPVWDVFGECRFNLPIVAIPLTTYSGQKPSRRLLFQAGPGDCEVVDIELGNTPIERTKATVKIIKNVTTVNFPVVEQVHPGTLLEDVYFAPVEYFAFALVDQADEIILDFELPRGLQRIWPATGDKDGHAFQLSIDYAPVGSGTWTGFAQGARFLGGHGVTVRGISASVVRVATESRTAELETFDPITPPGTLTKRQSKIAKKQAKFAKKKEKKAEKQSAKGKDLDVKHVSGTDQQTFFSISKKVTRGPVYEVRVRISAAPDIDSHRYGLARGGKGSASLLTDCRWLSLTGLRDEPAVRNLQYGGATFVDITLTGEALSSDQSDRISARVRPKRPILVGGARGATEVTSNPAALALWVMTGPLAGGGKYPDSEINFGGFQDFYDYCAATVPALDGTLEPRHRCDGVMDVDGKGMIEVAHDLVTSARGQLDFVDGKWTVVIDRKNTNPPVPLSDADVISVKSRFSWPTPPDAYRGQFLKDGQRDERLVFNDGFAKSTATASSVAITISRSGNRATFTRSSGTWTLFPDEGWLQVTLPALYSGTKSFLIYKGDGGTTLTVIDVVGTLTAGHSSSGTFATTAAVVIERRDLPYTQRASEVHRNLRHLFALQIRRAQHEVEVDWDWLLFTRGDLIELSSDVIAVGKGRARALDFAGAAGAVTEFRVDDEFDLTGVSSPGIRIRSRIPAGGMTVTQRNVNVSATNTKRTTTGDKQWVVVTSPLDTTTLGIKFGSDKGSLVTFGEIGAIALEMIVNRIGKGHGLTGVLYAHDHAPQLYDDVDVKPVPFFRSSLTGAAALADNQPPAAPVIPFRDLQVVTHLCQINAGAISSGSEQVFTRTDGGSFPEDGFLVGMSADFAGFSVAGNNGTSLPVINLTTSTLTVMNATAGAGAETGSGDERVIGGRRSPVGTIHIDAAATGLAAISVAPQGGGVVFLDGPPTEAIFAKFRGDGFVLCGSGFLAENQGVFPITGLRGGGDGITITNPAAVTETGNGAEDVEQTQFFAPGGILL